MKQNKLKIPNLKKFKRIFSNKMKKTKSRKTAMKQNVLKVPSLKKFKKIFSKTFLKK